jgi:two-component system, LytTR family, response regulator
MIKTIIIDDEAKARNALRNLIKSYCKEIEIIGEADCVGKGKEILEELECDLVFLDVQMPDGTGFDLLSSLSKIEFKIIFASAYDRFAISAFNFSAVDYILKPIEPDKLISSVKKVMEDMSLSGLHEKIEILLNNREGIKKIAIPTVEGISFIRIEQIVNCQSDSNYTKIFLVSGKSIVSSKTLKEFDDLLSSLNFFRIHKSHLINLDFLSRYRKGEGGSVIMENGVELEVSRRKKEKFLAILSER